jgi:DNA-binding response OmpR family regulator
MLTARSQKADKLRGLKLGADDYIIKPFDYEELLARIESLMRRVRPAVERVELGAVTIDFRAKQAWDARGPIELTHREFDLLRYLAERADGIVYRDELLRAVWGYPSMPNTRAVDYAIARLRKKIEADPHHPRFIHTARGDGYCLTVEGKTQLTGDES